jgi:hypothetical protein
MTDQKPGADEIDATDPAVTEYSPEEIAAMRAILAAVDAVSPSVPLPWSLGGDAPEPQKVDLPKPPPTTPEGIAAAAREQAKVKPAETHTGTDPLGRAVGPAEDHTEIKKVRDPETGKVVTPQRDGTLPKSKGRR